MKKAVLMVLVALGIFCVISGMDIFMDNWQLSQFPDSRIVPAGTEDEGRLRAFIGLIVIGLAYFFWPVKAEKKWDGRNSQPHLNYQNIQRSKKYKKSLGYF